MIHTHTAPQLSQPDHLEAESIHMFGGSKVCALVLER